MISYPLRQRELLSILFKEKRAILTVFFVLFGLCLGGSFLMSPKYEADAKLLIKSGREFENRPDPGQQAAVVPYLTKQEVMNSELEILTSTDLIRQTIERIGLDKIYPDIANNKDEPEGRALDKAVNAFQKSLKVDAAMMSEVISVTYLHKDREMAIQALNMLLQIYQEKHTGMFSDNRSSFLEQKTKDYMSQLDKVAGQITALRQSQSLYDVPTQRAQIIQDRSVVAETLRSLQTRSLDEHGHIAYYTARLKTLSPFSASGPGTADLKDARLRDPAYVDPVYDDAVLKLQAAEGDASALDQQIALQQKSIEAIDKRLQQMEESSAKLEALEREHATLDDLVRSSRSTYEQAMTNEQLDRQKIVSVDVFQKPDASTIPAKPRHLLYGLVGLFMGLLGALGILGYAMLFRQTLISAESVERILGLKVLATVPERG